MNEKNIKHRAIEVGKETMISLCESCTHMPSGKVPQSNTQRQNGELESPHMYCVKKAFFPNINYDNKGKPFYDVAKCDGYEKFINNKTNKKQNEIDIRRADE